MYFFFLLFILSFYGKIRKYLLFLKQTLCHREKSFLSSDWFSTLVFLFIVLILFPFADISVLFIENRTHSYHLDFALGCLSILFLSLFLSIGFCSFFAWFTPSPLLAPPPTHFRFYRELFFVLSLPAFVDFFRIAAHASTFCLLVNCTLYLFLAIFGFFSFFSLFSLSSDIKFVFWCSTFRYFLKGIVWKLHLQLVIYPDGRFLISVFSTHAIKNVFRFGSSWSYFFLCLHINFLLLILITFQFLTSANMFFIFL